MDIKLIKGPLCQEFLEAIASLYGSYDNKYKSVDFCRIQFNENPSGYSLHAFACDRNKIVGHIAVIPIEIYVNGERQLSGKAEAFCVKEKYRTKLIDGSYIGIILPTELFKFAIDEGIEVIHLIANEKVGMIHKTAGCKKINIHSKNFIFFINKYTESLRNKIVLKMIFRIIFITQRWMYKFLYLISLFFPKITINNVSHENEEIYKIQFEIKPDNNLFIKDKWSIAKSKSNILWFFRTGIIDVYRIGNSNEEYIILRKNLTPNGVVEIVDCRLNIKSGFPNLIFLLCYIIQRAEKEKASMIIISDQVLSSKLKIVIRFFGFLKKTSKIGFYVKSNEQFFLREENILFNPFFYATF